MTTHAPLITIGIDGSRKGFHAVALTDGAYSSSPPQAPSKPSNYYGWMLRGAALVQALETSHPLLTSLPGTDQPCCFETFPHAITWHLRGGDAQARQKRPQRLALLQQDGIETTALRVC